MKKLRKNINCSLNTVEAMASCTCSCTCNCSKCACTDITNAAALDGIYLRNWNAGRNSGGNAAALAG